MADTIIYLDIPLWRRLTNHAKRMLQRSVRHKELSIWQDLTFFIEMVKRTSRSKGKLEKLLSKYGEKIVLLKSYKEIDKYLQELTYDVQ